MDITTLYLIIFCGLLCIVAWVCGKIGAYIYRDFVPGPDYFKATDSSSAANKASDIDLITDPIYSDYSGNIYNVGGSES